MATVRDNEKSKICFFSNPRPRALKIRSISFVNPFDRFYPDSMTLTYLILKLIENGHDDLAIQAIENIVLKDMATTAGIACLSATVLGKYSESVSILIEEKRYYALLRILGTQYSELSFMTDYGNYGLANIQNENRIVKVRNRKKNFRKNIVKF